MYDDCSKGYSNTHPQIAVIVLGAGLSSRFGAMDKLGAVLAGQSVAHHILAALQPFDWSGKRLVCQNRPHWVEAYVKAGFTIVENDHPECGMLSSLRLGVDSVADQSMVMVCLADMPFVTTEHIARLRAAAGSAKGRAVASKADGYRGPPAIFPLADLKRLPASGEGGARSLLANSLFVDCTIDKLMDIDTKSDLMDANNK